MALVKICGLSEPATLAAALDAGADMVGFVFFERSPRHVAPDQARSLGRLVAGRAKKVALTVDAGDDALEAVVASLAPDLLQRHGRETPERVAAVRARFGLPVMRVIAVAATVDRAAVAAFAAVADYLMFDAVPSPDASRPGGNGAAFDWQLLAGVASAKPWFLAGGLNDANVAQALATTGAAGVDVSSGVERAPGVKDPQLIARFVAQARRGAAGVGSPGPIG